MILRTFVAASALVVLCVFVGYKLGLENNQMHIHELKTREQNSQSTGSGNDASAEIKGAIDDWSKFVEYLPKSPTLCDNLFPEFQFPKSLWAEWGQYNKVIAKEFNKVGEGEAGVGQLLGQQKLYYHLANMEFVNTVCEIGFNMGHGAFFWLASSPSTMLYSFDLGSHPYVRPLAAHLKYQYRERFHLYLGDSAKTVPAFAKQLPMVKCDALIIDGGHNYPIAKSDINSMHNIANTHRNIVIFDDYPNNKSYFDEQLGKAWQEAEKEQKVSNLYQCLFACGNRGFTVAHYTFK